MATYPGEAYDLAMSRGLPRNPAERAILRPFPGKGWPLPARGDDRLSRTASAIAATIRSHELGAEMSAGYDGGEFSGPACDRMLQRDIARIIEHFGWTPDSYRAALTGRTSERFAHWSGLDVRGLADEPDNENY